MPENEEAFEIYTMVRNQVVTAGMGEPVDISIPALVMTMDELGIERGPGRRATFLKVISVARKMLESAAGGAE